MQTRINTDQDIQKVEETMQQLVIQQLGDKFNYDSSLHELGQFVQNKQSQDNLPLESMIRNALNYDSNVYKEALGITNQSFGEPNGVLKSQEFAKKYNQMKN